MDLLYRDSAVLVVAKQLGVSTEETLESLRRMIGAEVRPVHRLDQPVSGALAVALDRGSAANMNRQLSQGTFTRRYAAVCRRDDSVPEGLWEDRVVFNRRSNRGEQAHGNDGAVARLISQRAGRTDRYDVWTFTLETGRRHQIRLQCSIRGIPVVGDLKYGARRSRRGGGIYLHSLQVAFLHPGDGRRITIWSHPKRDPLWQAAV